SSSDSKSNSKGREWRWTETSRARGGTLPQTTASLRPQRRGARWTATGPRARLTSLPDLTELRPHHWGGRVAAESLRELRHLRDGTGYAKPALSRIDDIP